MRPLSVGPSQPVIADMFTKAFAGIGTFVLPLSACARFEQLFDQVPETVFFLKRFLAESLQQRDRRNP